MISYTAVKELVTYIRLKSKDPRRSQLNLHSYLMLPVQRLPRYKMLLQKLLQYTPERHGDYNLLIQASQNMLNVVDTLNECKRSCEIEMAKISNFLEHISFNSYSINTELILFPPLTRKYYKSATFKIIKFVELEPKLKTSLISKKCNVRKTVYKCTEYEFNPYESDFSQELRNPEYSKWDISGVSGKRVILHLFNDMVLFCANDVLICALSVGGIHCSSEFMTFDENIGVLRLCDGYNIAYFKGDADELASWQRLITPNMKSKPDNSINLS